MKGLELSRRFYEEYGRPALEGFPEALPLISVGLMGSGSECLGYDDEVSRDHDFEPGFCIFIPDESILDRRTAFLLERAYAKLPKEFLGYKRSPLSPVGGNRHGVILLSDFVESKTGTPDGRLSVGKWLTVPEQSLLELTNGEVFFDGSGELTEIRSRLSYLPEDVRLKKLAGELLIMCQSGQYNYPRCIGRGETAAAQLCINEFVKAAMHTVFLLNKRYMPYYKWSFRALRELEALSALAPDLEELISTPNLSDTVPKKTSAIDNICASVTSHLKLQSLTKLDKDVLEGHAYSVNSMIKGEAVRNLHILAGV